MKAFTKEQRAEIDLVMEQQEVLCARISTAKYEFALANTRMEEMFQEQRQHDMRHLNSLKTIYRTMGLIVSVPLLIQLFLLCIG